MAHNPAAEIASTLQSASINRHPDPRYDLNPSTAASEKIPVKLSSSSDADVDDLDEDEVPLSALRPQPRRPTLPPLPDLRFEQSYLKSIEQAEGYGFKSVGYITLRDQVFLPLVQGVVWTLLQSGWRFWNRQSQFSGAGVGAKIRRWWWGVNHWNVPADRMRKASEIGEVSNSNPWKCYEERWERVGGNWD